MRLEDYGLLSDCRTAALVGKDGSIDWLCLPRFDASACFARLLGSDENGFWRLGPRGTYHSERRYHDGTWVLETHFENETGAALLTDCLLVGTAQPTLVRLVQGLRGQIDFLSELAIRFEYGSVVPWVRRRTDGRHGLRAVAGPEALTLLSPVPVHGRDLRSLSQFSVRAGDCLPFVLSWYPSVETPPLEPENPYHAMRRTQYWWKEWTDRSQYQGLDAVGVQRSLLTLKALTYERTGGIVAAPTTSLPEELGGERNWDYRYCWLRDATFTLYSLLGAGYREEAERWRAWLVRTVAGTPSQVNILYGLGGERRVPEEVLPWLTGYEGSRPVRIGNAAYRQLQLDVFGEVMDTLDLALRQGLGRNDDTWAVQRQMVKFVCQHWSEPDEGIWEVRGPRRHFTHSKVMAWVAVDRAIKAIEEFGFEGPLENWRELRARIHRDVCEQGYDSRLKSFVQYYGGKELDASLLLMSLVGFLPPDDPRIRGTVEAIASNLMEGGLIRRYASGSAIDGLPGNDGTFLPCSFWLVDNYVLLKEVERAQELFDGLLAFRNDLGLFAEEYSPVQKRMLGNFPQAFSHIAHINSACNLNRHAAPADDRSRAGQRETGRPRSAGPFASTAGATAGARTGSAAR